MLVAGVMAAVAALSGAGSIYRGQRWGRPDVAAWVQTETALAADLLCGGRDPRSSVVGLLERALAALPAAVRAAPQIAVRVDAGYFAGVARTERVCRTR